MTMGTKRQRYDQRLAALKQARASWEPAWREITEQLVPYRTVWTATQRSRGDKKDQQLLNSRPTQALKTLDAGMMAGITSPARDWFGLTTSDPKLAEIDAVKSYLDEVRRIIASTLHASNWYRALASGTYMDICSIGTAAMFQEEGQPGQISFRSLPIGEYYLDCDHEDRIDCCYREVYLTVRQIVLKFGVNNCPQVIRNAWDRCEYQKGYTVIHAVQPNDEYEHGRAGRHGMRYSSCWWMQSDDRADAFLRESGYEEFPILAPRWSFLPGDVYGRGPGWDVRGDCRMLQHLEKRKMQMVDKVVDPPMRATDNVKRSSLLPGDVTHVPAGSDGKFEPAIDTSQLPRAIEACREEISVVEDRIREGLYAHLWQMLVDDERAQRATATEIEAKREEKMLLLGPLLENLNNELLEPAIERTFAILERADILPLPPEELEGQPVKIEFISIMHQMQQKTGLVSIHTLMQEVGAIAQMRPDVLDKIDADAAVDEIARITGVRPDIVLSQDKVDQQRQARAAQEQAKQQGEAMLAATQGVRNLSGADPTRLSELAQSITPAAAAQGGALAPLSAA